MNTSGIEALLQKFYEGNTSLQEEKSLREFFQGKDVPVHLKSHQPLFSFYSDEQRQEISDQDFELNLTAQLTEDQDEIPVVQMRPNRNRIMFIAGIAASFLLLIGLVFTFQQDVFRKSLKQAGNPDPEIAYADVSQALMLVSGNLNNGLKQVERLQMVDKAMKNIQLFNKFYQYQTIIINPDEIRNQSIKSR
jgi:hypothetical protein